MKHIEHRHCLTEPQMLSKLIISQSCKDLLRSHNSRNSNIDAHVQYGEAGVKMID